jgi:CCR4-NOT transcription complex subunit 2
VLPSRSSCDIIPDPLCLCRYNRNWRFYRGGLNLWLTKEENVQPTHKDLRAEKGVYIFWDPASWSKVSREFVLAYDALEERTVGVNQASMTGNGQPQQQQQQQQQGLTGSAPLSQQQPSSQLAQIGA